MTNDMVHKMVCALDIGTSKVVALIAEIDESDKINIIGVGSQPSRGLKKGVIVNIDATVNAIEKAVNQAEQMAGCDIGAVCVGIAGSHIRSFDSSGVVAVEGSEVSSSDIDRVIDAAKAVAMPMDQQVLHILPQTFIIDNQSDIKEPIGMSGVRLEVHVHMVTGSISAVQNIVKCVNRCGLDVADMALEQLASSHAVLTEDEKELGVCLVDIGGGTTDVAVFVDGAIRHTAVFPVAGAQVTSDIAHALRTPTDAAEAIKIQHGCAMTKLVKNDQAIEIPSVANHPARRLPLQTLANVIEARAEEILSMVLNDLSTNNLLESLSGGIVLTGGASKLHGFINLAQEVFRMPVRMGLPCNVTGVTDVINNPMHATGAGLLLYSHIKSQSSKVDCDDNLEEYHGIWTKMKRWFGKHL